MTSPMNMIFNGAVIACLVAVMHMLHSGETFTPEQLLVITIAGAIAWRLFWWTWYQWPQFIPVFWIAERWGEKKKNQSGLAKLLQGAIMAAQLQARVLPDPLSKNHWGKRLMGVTRTIAGTAALLGISMIYFPEHVLRPWFPAMGWQTLTNIQAAIGLLLCILAISLLSWGNRRDDKRKKQRKQAALEAAKYDWKTGWPDA